MAGWDALMAAAIGGWWKMSGWTAAAIASVIPVPVARLCPVAVIVIDVFRVSVVGGFWVIAVIGMGRRLHHKGQCDSEDKSGQTC